MMSYEMSESQHSTIDFGMSENSGGRGIALAMGIGGCVGAGVVGGQISDVVSLVMFSKTNQHGHRCSIEYTHERLSIRKGTGL